MPGLHQPRGWVMAFGVTLPLVVGITVARIVLTGTDQGSGTETPPPGPTVVVVVDASTYAPGDPITATVTNGTSMGIAPMGGIVCQDTPWPFTLQRLDDSGVWQDVVFPPTPPCIGVAVAMLPPGQSQSTTFAASADPGTYRVAYTFRAADGTEGTATSTPFLIGSP